MTLLRNWSELIEAKFICDNDPPRVMTTATATSMIDSVNHMNSNIAMVKNAQQDANKSLEILTAKFEAVMGRLDNVVDENNELKALLAGTPETTPRKRQRVVNESESPKSTTDDSNNEPSLKSFRIADLASDNPMSKQKIKGVTIQECLEMLFLSVLKPIVNHVQSDGTFMLETVELGFVAKNDKGKYNSAMEAIFLSCSPMQLKQLRRELPLESNIKDLTKSIQNQAMKLMYQLEGRHIEDINPYTPKKNQNHNTSKQLKPFVLGFGTRALNYKKTKCSSKNWRDKRMWECLAEKNIQIPSMPLATGTAVEISLATENVASTETENENTEESPQPSPSRRLFEIFKSHF